MKLRHAAVACAIALTAMSFAEYRVVVIQRTGVPGPGSGGANITTVNSPFVNANQQTGFSGSFGTNFVWFDSGIVWDNSMFAGLSGGEATMGISNTGKFIYSPSLSGDDCVYGDTGLILKQGDPAPLVAGKFCSFASRPTMDDNGVAYWVSGWSDTAGGSSVGRILYGYDGTSYTGYLRSGDIVDGAAVTASGVGFDYQFSNDGSNWVNLTVVSGANGTLVLTDNGVLARQGGITNRGDLWQNFRSMNMNNAGTCVFMGDTNASASTDDFIAVNGNIEVTEADTLDDVALTGNATRLCATGNDGLVGHLWGAVASSKLFLGRDSVLLGSRFIIGSGSRVSLDGDWEPEATINEIQGSMTIAPALSIREGVIYARALITQDGVGQYTAIICIPLAKVGDVDVDGEVNLVDFGLLSSAFGSGPLDPNWIAHADIDFDGEVNLVDFQLLSNNFGN